MSHHDSLLKEGKETDSYGDRENTDFLLTPSYIGSLVYKTRHFLNLKLLLTDSDSIPGMELIVTTLCVMHEQL